MTHMLDETRPFAETHGGTYQGRYEQDGLTFDATKRLIGEIPKNWKPTPEEARTNDGRAVLVGSQIHPDQALMDELRMELASKEAQLEDIASENQAESQRLLEFRAELDAREAALLKTEKTQPDQNTEQANDCMCEHCRRVFGSSQGRASHERACEKNPEKI